MRLRPCSGFEQPRGEGIPVFFHELAAGRFFRAVKRSILICLPVLLHDICPGGERACFFHHAFQGWNGRPNQIKNQNGPEAHASLAEGVEKEQGEEGIEDGRGFEEKFIVHDARTEEKAACHHPQRDVVPWLLPARWKEQRPRQQDAQNQRRQEAGVFDGTGMEQEPVLPVMIDFSVPLRKQAGEAASSVQMGVKDGHDRRAQDGDPENRLG